MFVNALNLISGHFVLNASKKAWRRKPTSRYFGLEMDLRVSGVHVAQLWEHTVAASQKGGGAKDASLTILPNSNFDGIKCAWV